MDILRQIIDMDNNAIARVEASLEKQRRRTDEFGESSERERENQLKAERVRNEALRLEQEKALEERRSMTEKSRDDRTRALDKCFDENRARWKAEILKRITEE